MKNNRRGTLASQLQPRLVIIVACMALLVIVSTLAAARTILYDQLDADLSNAQVRQGRGPGGDRVPGISVPGMQAGTIIAIETNEGHEAGGKVSDGRVEDLDSDAVKALLAVPADDQKRTVTIPELGSYRVVARETSIGRVVVCLPIDNVNRALVMLGVFSGGVGLIAVAATALITRMVLGKATKPLLALSDTADEVTQLDLERGTVAVPRVETNDEAASNEVSRLSAAFNRMLHRVEGALGARELSEAKLRQFVADASHELRNPLAAISGYAELAQRSPDAEGTAHALKRISAESQRMSKLVNDLLLLARLDADAKIETKPVDVVEVVLNAVSDAQATSRDHKWQLDLPQDCIEVMADPDRLHQVMVNLLSNARTHTPAGTTVTTTVRAVTNQAVITVVDNGPGMPQDVLQNIFERFTKGDDSRAHTSHQSTGLGLAIVRAVVEGFDGTVTVTSRPGETTFTVKLPLQPKQHSL